MISPRDAGVRTCPRCLLRVFPTPDGMCPACRRFDFNAAPSDPATVRAALEARARATTRTIRRVATLHWRLVFQGAPLVPLYVATVIVRHSGTGFLGSPPPDKASTEALFLFVSVVLTVAAAFTSCALATELAVEESGVGWTRPLDLLRASIDYLEEHGVKVGFFGPEMSTLPDGEEE